MSTNRRQFLQYSLTVLGATAAGEVASRAGRAAVDQKTTTGPTIPALAQLDQGMDAHAGALPATPTSSREGAPGRRWIMVIDLAKCDGCGKCCLVKLEDADNSDRTYFTDVGCRLLDGDTCGCKDYNNRAALVDDCVQLTPDNIDETSWLPPTCAYRLINEGRDLYWWHPLVSGDPDTVHQAGVSVRGRVGDSEVNVPDSELENYIVSWPLRIPKAARKKRP